MTLGDYARLMRAVGRDAKAAEFKARQEEIESTAAPSR